MATERDADIVEHPLADIRIVPEKRYLYRHTTPTARSPKLLLPANHDAEAKVLGIVLRYPFTEALSDMREVIIEPGWFHCEAHRVIAEAIYTLDDNRDPVEVESVTHQLEITGKLEQASRLSYGDGSMYLHTLMKNAGPAEYSMRYYAEIVADKASRRREIASNESLYEILQAIALNLEIPPEERARLADAVMADVRKELGAVKSQVSPYHSLTLAEIRNLPKPQPLLGSILWQQAVHILYGESSTWKSKIAESMVGCIVLGIDWLGHPVKQGPVLYIAGEGGNLVGWDMLAWFDAHGVYGTDVDALPFRLVTRPPDLCKIEEIEAFTRVQVQEFEAAYGALPVLIVDDTLSTSMSGNENDAQVINAVYHSLRTMQHTMGCSALVIHHTGKDPSREERGNYAIRGNADATMIVNTGNIPGGNLAPGIPVSLESRKPYKAAAKFPAVNLTTKPHKLVDDAGNELYQSLVVIPADHSPTPKVAKEPAGNVHAANLLKMIREEFLNGARDSDLQQTFRERYHVSESTYKRAKELLDAAGNIRNIGGLWQAY